MSVEFKSEQPRFFSMDEKSKKDRELPGPGYYETAAIRHVIKSHNSARDKSRRVRAETDGRNNLEMKDPQGREEGSQERRRDGGCDPIFITEQKDEQNHGNNNILEVD